MENIPENVLIEEKKMEMFTHIKLCIYPVTNFLRKLKMVVIFYLIM